jgi:UPF0271 protein
MEDKKTVAINCDMAEEDGPLSEHSKALFPLLYSCNISCGAHAGDALQIQQTIAAAIAHRVQIGAHPSYPDRIGFGRRDINISNSALKASLFYQLHALKGMVEYQAARISYVKAHGALYHAINNNKHVAELFAEIVLSIDENMSLMGCSGSVLEQAAVSKGGQFIAEAFLDRRYNNSGGLVQRGQEKAIISQADEVLEQVLDLVVKHQVQSLNGYLLPIKATSFCVHGDHSNTLDILRYLQKELPAFGIQLANSHKQ